MSDTLVAAKQEYTQQLSDILCPCLYQGFKTIWKTCKSSDIDKKLKLFQEKLRSVPLWNQNVIDSELERICKKEETKVLIDKLIEAVFLSNVKVLSSVRLGKAKALNIKVPETKSFIHQCYIEGARKLWKDPHLIDDRELTLGYSEIKRNEKRLLIALYESIEKTISKMIPISNILENYLNGISSDTESESEEKTEEFEESSKDSEHKEDTEEKEESYQRDSELEKEEDDLFMNENSLYVTEGDTLKESTENFVETKPISININKPEPVQQDTSEIYENEIFEPENTVRENEVREKVYFSDSSDSE